MLAAGSAVVVVGQSWKTVVVFEAVAVVAVVVVVLVWLVVVVV